MKREILGVEVDDVSLVEALAKVKDQIDSGKKGYIVTPNPEIIVRAQSDHHYKSILNGAFLSLADGFGITAASKILRKPIIERIAGVDFVAELAALAAEHGYSLFLLGAAEGVAAQAAEKLKNLFPSLNIVGTYSGGALEKNQQKILEEVQKVSVDILIAAFGPPKQERWIAENLPALNVKVAVGVGGALDFIAGEKPRAPVWMRKVGLEWFFRLVNEPTRAKRQLSLIKFVYLVFKEKFSK